MANIKPSWPSCNGPCPSEAVAATWAKKALGELVYVFHYELGTHGRWGDLVSSEERAAIMAEVDHSEKVHGGPYAEVIRTAPEYDLARAPLEHRQQELNQRCEERWNSEWKEVHRSRFFPSSR